MVDVDQRFLDGVPRTLITAPLAEIEVLALSAELFHALKREQVFRIGQRADERVFEARQRVPQAFEPRLVQPWWLELERARHHCLDGRAPIGPVGERPQLDNNVDETVPLVILQALLELDKRVKEYWEPED